MEPFATLDQLKKHWSLLPEEVEEEAEQKLIESSIFIRGLYPSIDAWIASGRVALETVVYVSCVMVATIIKREMEVPESEDVSQLSFAAGGFSQSVQFRIRDAELFLSRAHRQLLTGGGARNRKAFMIMPGS